MKKKNLLQEKRQLTADPAFALCVCVGKGWASRSPRPPSLVLLALLLSVELTSCLSVRGGGTHWPHKSNGRGKERSLSPLPNPRGSQPRSHDGRLLGERP
jgi:hypothetical protein